MKLTEELIFAGLNNGAINAKQLVALGLSWPPRSGWIRRLTHSEISPEQYQLFLSLKGQGKHGKARIKRKEKPWPSQEEWLSFEPSEEINLGGKPEPLDLELNAWL